MQCLTQIFLFREGHYRTSGGGRRVCTFRPMETHNLESFEEHLIARGGGGNPPEPIPEFNTGITIVRRILSLFTL